MSQIPLFISAERWTDELVQALPSHVEGIILGDLFCQKRMFANGWFDIPSIAELARTLDLQVVFQTPAYNTDSSMDTTISLLRRLHSSHSLDAVLLHDIGLVQTLKNWPNIELWWDKFAFGRDFVPNAHLVTFLKANQISRVEIVRSHNIDVVVGNGCKVLLFSYGPKIASFGRVCYTQYFLNRSCETEILCARYSPSITSVDKMPFEFVASGHTLLDAKDPLQTKPLLAPTDANKISGVTAHLRRDDDVCLLRHLKTDLE